VKYRKSDDKLLGLGVVSSHGGNLFSSSSHGKAVFIVNCDDILFDKMK
jgi:hypothetical protein